MNIKNVIVAVMAICLGMSFNAFAANGNGNGKGNANYSNQYRGNAQYHDTESDSAQYSDTESDSAQYSDSKDSYEPYDEDTKQRLALNLVGKGDMYEKYVPDIDGDKNPDLASCFDVDLKNIADGELVGTATDCLSDITPAGSGEGVKLIGTTFFNLPNGQIVTRGLTTVQPVLQDTVTPDGEYITHITGASSDKNSVLHATGDYKWYRGTVRLSGMVNLTEFTNSVGDPIFFDCLFIIDLKKINNKHPHWYKWYKKYFGHNFHKTHYGYGGDGSYEQDDSYDAPYK
ncbi:hypothetical protein ACFL53_02415 [Pseudomonadota bacterium]